jgi:hypothetical protein
MTLGLGFGVCSSVARGQCTATWTPPLQAPGLNGPVSAVLPLGATDMLVGGSFTAAGGVLANGIARYSMTTGRWSAFGDGALNGAVLSILRLSSGEIVVGGYFTLSDPWTHVNLARLDAATGHWVGLTSFIDGPVHAMTELADGSLVVGGRFTDIDFIELNGIARLQPQTGTWSAMGTQGLWAVGEVSVHAVAAMPDGRVIVGGEFAGAGGFATPNIAVFNLASGLWSSAAGGVVRSDQFRSQVQSIVPLADGGAVVAGDFAMAGTMPAMNIARLSPDGQAWTTMGQGSVQPVYSALRSSTGAIIATGAFPAASGGTTPGIARFDEALQQWDIIAPLLVPQVRIVQLSSEQIVVGGIFDRAGDRAALNIALLDPVAGVWVPLGTGPDGQIMDMVVEPGGTVLVGGLLKSIGGLTGSVVARYHPNDQSWSTVGQPLLAELLSLVRLSTGEIVAAGRLFPGQPGGPDVRATVKLDTASGSWVQLGPVWGSFPVAQALCPLPGGDLAASMWDLSSWQRELWVYRSSTQTWQMLTQVLGTVTALCAPSPNTLVIGGDFLHPGGGAATGIAAYDLLTGIWTPMGPPIRVRVTSMTGLPGGDVLIGGLDLSTAGSSPGFLGRLSPSTGTWTPVVTSFDGRMDDMQDLGNGRVLIGGTFSQLGGVAATNLAVYDTAISQVAALPGDRLQPVTALAVLPDGRVIAGGRTEASAAYFTMQIPPTACRADFDCSRHVTIDDIFVYLNAWFATNPRCDVSGDGLVNLDDIFIFLNLWFAGC